MARACNTARSLSTLGQQASVYVRLAAPPSSLPDYVHLQTRSDWMTTALLCAGLESSTLPTRLTASAHKRGSLTLFEDALNTNGHQNLVELQASVTSATINSREHGNVVIAEHAIGRAPPRENDATELQPEPTVFDINYSPELGQQPATKSFHIFAQIECERDHLESDPPQLTLDPEERLRRRLNEESVVEM